MRRTVTDARASCKRGTDLVSDADIRRLGPTRVWRWIVSVLVSHRVSRSNIAVDVYVFPSYVATTADGNVEGFITPMGHSRQGR